MLKKSRLSLSLSRSLSLSLSPRRHQGWTDLVRHPQNQGGPTGHTGFLFCVGHASVIHGKPTTIQYTQLKSTKMGWPDVGRGPIAYSSKRSQMRMHDRYNEPAPHHTLA